MGAGGWLTIDGAGVRLFEIARTYEKSTPGHFRGPTTLTTDLDVNLDERNIIIIVTVVSYE